MIPGQQAISGFDPRSIPGLKLWLDAADSNTLSLIGNRVIRWTDKTSNAYYFSNTSTGPTRTTTLNGLDVLTFTASNATDVTGTFLAGVGATSFPYSRHAIFLVHKPSITNGSNYGNANAITFTSATGNLLFPASGASGSLGYSNSAVYTRTYATNDVSTAYNITVANLNETTLSLFLNGTQQSSQFLYSTPSAIVDAVCSNYIGSLPTGSNFYSGTIAEILVYSNAVSFTDQVRIEGYLAWKWGLQTSLPATRPFSSNAPLVRQFQPNDIPDCILWFDAADTRTLTLTGTQVTSWRNKGTLSVTATNTTAAPLVVAPGTVSSGYTFNTSPLNTLQFPARTYLAVSNVVTTVAERTIFFIFTVTSYGDGYSSMISSSTLSGNRQLTFNAWNRDTDTINLYPVAYSATELLGCLAQAPYSGTLPYNATPFIVGLRHTTDYTGTSNVINAVTINGSNVVLNGTPNGRLAYGYYTGTDTFFIGTGPNYSNVQQIGEVIQYDRALTDSEMRYVEGYLGWKWGVTLADTTHAYYRISPTVPTSFFPGALPGCILWLDAADTTTLTTSGSSVTSWRDKSGYRNDISFTTSPTTGTVTQNGNNVLAFSSNYGSNLNVKINTANHTLIAVHKPATIDVDNNSIFRFQDGLSGTPYVVFPLFSGGRRGYVTSADGASLSNTGAGLLENSSATSYTLIMASIASTSLEVFSNATLVASNTSTLTSADTSGLIFGGITTTALYTGNIAEVLVFNTKLSPSQQQRVEGYLSWKWGTPLPSTHPYALVSPSVTVAGSIVRRGLYQWFTPNSYTKASGTTWTPIVNVPGSSFTIVGIATANVATTPGGFHAMNVTTASSFQSNTGTFSTPITYDLWVNPSGSSFSASTVLIETDVATYSSATASISVLSNAAGRAWRATIAVGNTIDTSFESTLVGNTWNHLALSIAGSSGSRVCAFYWNGTLVRSQTFTVTRTGASQVGLNVNSGPTSGTFRGRIGDLKIYTVALDASEVKQNYNTMAPYYGRPVIL